MKVTQREKKKAKFRISFIILFIFASFAICFTMYMKEDFEITEEMLDEHSKAVVYIDSSGRDSILVNPVPKSEKKNAAYYSDAVFIGSAALAGLSDYGYTDPENMLLSDSIRLNNFSTLILSENDEQSSIAETVQRKAASNVYIMVGLYDLADIDSNELFSSLEAFIESVGKQGAGKKIYLISLLPVPAETEGMIASNADIDTYNSLLLKFADKMRVSYLDVNTDFKGNDGKLPSSAAELNGIRLKEE
ncbi:MAG: hypothetical protein K2J72_11420 [Oscillospiraceae bacterium]|nr:hypothetical protein [Oscillospiraceae bacterium]